MPVRSAAVGAGQRPSPVRAYADARGAGLHVRRLNGYDMQATIITDDHEVNLMALIRRHDELWDEWNRLSAIDEYHPQIDALSCECREHELQILLAPALTTEELEGKRRVVERGAITDDFGIVDAIFERDAERIAAAA
jgi:hypothetical protein